MIIHKGEECIDADRLVLRRSEYIDRLYYSIFKDEYILVGRCCK